MTSSACSLFGRTRTTGQCSRMGSNYIHWGLCLISKTIPSLGFSSKLLLICSVSAFCYIQQFVSSHWLLVCYQPLHGSRSKLHSSPPFCTFQQIRTKQKALRGNKSDLRSSAIHLGSPQLGTTRYFRNQPGWIRICGRFSIHHDKMKVKLAGGEDRKASVEIYWVCGALYPHLYIYLTFFNPKCCKMSRCLQL